MSTTDVLDANGVVKAIQDPLAPGRAAAAESRPVALSTEDLAQVALIVTRLTSISGFVDQLEGYLDTVETLLAAATPAGTNVIGRVGVNQQYVATGKNSFYRNAGAGTNAALIVAGPRMLYNVEVYNQQTSWIYVKYYNKATTPDPATDTPVLVVACPPGQAFQRFDLVGTPFALGLGIVIVKGPAATDTTATEVGAVQVMTQYSA